MAPKKRFNAVISFIILTDFLLTTSASLTAPIFALFVVGLNGGSAKTVGFALAAYWIVKSILQLPIAKFLDRNHGEIDDYYSMLAGVTLGAFVMFGYSFATQGWHIIALQACFGVADSMLVPPFYAMFSRHINKGKESFQWAIRSSLSYGGGAALGGALGGILVAIIGFRHVFVTASIIYASSALVLMFLKPFILPKTSKVVERIFVEQKKL